ncbi:MAG: dethiobiotin synthase, partial [Sphingorhabdus sp.]
MSNGFVITGTDTDVGKTIFAAALVGALNGFYWKAVQAGLADGSDRETVAQLSGLPAAHILNEAYRLTTPCSPHRAAEIDGAMIEAEQLNLPRVDGPLVVEGAGGVLVPLSRGNLSADQFVTWQLPVIIVARTALGTINHSLLSIEALRNRGVAIHGIAFVGDAQVDSENIICEIGPVRRLGRLPILPELNAQSLGAAFLSHFSL